METSKNNHLNPVKHISLVYFFNTYKNNKSLQSISEKYSEFFPLKKLSSESHDNLKLINLYNDAIPAIENIIWEHNTIKENISYYQRLFHELEKLHSLAKTVNRHHIVIAIPVADRPQHLKQCLLSLLNLCTLYNYGGFKNDKFTHVKILICDDSQHIENQNEIKHLADRFWKKGLEVEYFGLNEQLDIVKKYTHNNNDTTNIIGKIDSENFHHKGASITRNIAYLKLNEIKKSHKKILFYFIDSDQEFQVKIKTKQGEEDIYAINYFYHLDQIFSNQDINILTGKVVGDPPVSPSVMVGNFLTDLIAFITKISNYRSDEDCKFHLHEAISADDASYHDMADLFGFKSTNDSHHYSCMIKGNHDHAQCFSALSAKLNQFFDGVHPTRKSYYAHEDILSSVIPARTIYTGNYIFNSFGLQYFIPFAHLKLRMAGPTLGRIIKSDMSEKFVSANLPMLHKRTVSTNNQSEFRPGVSRNNTNVDLSGEFTRQFFGDVMLFSLQALTDLGFPEKKLSYSVISNRVNETITFMRIKYNIKHNENIDKIQHLQQLINNKAAWWSTNNSLKDEIQYFDSFIKNIDYNFGKNASIYTTLFSDDNLQSFHNDITNALLNYPADKDNWNNILYGRRN